MSGSSRIWHKLMGEFWYEKPHQVRCFLYNKGIVFHNFFVDARTGIEWKVRDLMRLAALRGLAMDDLFIEYDDWEDFSEDI